MATGKINKVVTGDGSVKIFDHGDGTSTTITLPRGYRGWFVVTSYNVNFMGVFVVGSSSSGSVGLLTVSKGSNLTVTTSADTISISTGGGGYYVEFHTVEGNEPT